MRLYKRSSLKHLYFKKIPTDKALSKYAYSNFTLQILKYCDKKESRIEKLLY